MTAEQAYKKHFPMSRSVPGSNGHQWWWAIYTWNEAYGTDKLVADAPRESWAWAVACRARGINPKNGKKKEEKA